MEAFLTAPMAHGYELQARIDGGYLVADSKVPNPRCERAAEHFHATSCAGGRARVVSFRIVSAMTVVGCERAAQYFGVFGARNIPVESARGEAIQRPAPHLAVVGEKELLTHPSTK